eukprot:2949879-Pyramimonas_sp.AAC.1
MSTSAGRGCMSDAARESSSSPFITARLFTNFHAFSSRFSGFRSSSRGPVLRFETENVLLRGGVAATVLGRSSGVSRRGAGGGQEG